MMNGLEILVSPVILLAAGFLVILGSRFARISPIIGFLIAGILLGPHGFEVLEDNKTVHILAELGVVFLLFDIGLHFSMKSAWKLRKDLFGLAPLQLVLSTIVLGFVMAFAFSVQSDLALLIGLTLALSSTAVVMQVMADLKQAESPVGHSAKAILIFQDIVAIFLLIFADAIGSGGDLGTIALMALGKGILAFGAAIILGQYILTPLMKYMIRYDDPEMFTVFGLLIVIVTAYATANLGLSLTLGAFLAGMVLAETPFRILLQTELRPFRSLLMAFFFLTIGMLLDPVMIWDNIASIVAITALIMATKGAIIAALTYVLGRPFNQVLQLTFLLAQGSEFAFVVFSLAAVQTAMGTGFAQELIAAVALSMLLTPFIAQLAYKFSLQLCDKIAEGVISNCPGGENRPAVNEPVFIVGMNEVGKTLARAFQSHNIPYIAIDHDRQRFLEATAAGYIVAYGSSSDLRFWNMLGVAKARSICITAPRYEVAVQMAPMVGKIYANLTRYVAVEDSQEAMKYAALGLVPINKRGAPPGLEMAGEMLRIFGIEEEEIASWSDEEQSSYLKTQTLSNVITLKKNLETEAA